MVNASLTDRSRGVQLPMPLVDVVFIDHTAVLKKLPCRLSSRFFASTLLIMGHKTIACIICGSKTVLYIHMVIFVLIPQDLLIALLHIHKEEYNFFFFSVRCCF
jgi:hypothetical protein